MESVSLDGATWEMILWDLMEKRFYFLNDDGMLGGVNEVGNGIGD